MKILLLFILIMYVYPNEFGIITCEPNIYTDLHFTVKSNKVDIKLIADEIFSSIIYINGFSLKNCTNVYECFFDYDLKCKDNSIWIELTSKSVADIDYSIIYGLCNKAYMLIFTISIIGGILLILSIYYLYKYLKLKKVDNYQEMIQF
jgi:hypothetical protein